jgi:hypothetical protein
MAAPGVSRNTADRRFPSMFRQPCFRFASDLLPASTPGSMTNLTHRLYGRSGGIRTHDPLSPRQVR